MNNSALKSTVVQFPEQPRRRAAKREPIPKSRIVSRDLVYTISDAALVKIPQGCSTREGPSRVEFRQVRLQVEITSRTALHAGQFYPGVVRLYFVVREDGTEEFVVRVQVEPELKASNILSLPPARANDPHAIGGARICFTWRAPD